VIVRIPEGGNSLAQSGTLIAIRQLPISTEKLLDWLTSASAAMNMLEDNMDSNISKCFLGIVAAVIVWTSSQVALAQEWEVITGGELEYQNHCAVCHGVDGKGYGIMTKFLTISPSDLTQIAKRNAGRFSFWQVYRVIDGREEVRGHGTRKMPIWGARFQAEAKGSDPGSQSQAAGRILGLVFYLQHIQE